MLDGRFTDPNFLYKCEKHLKENLFFLVISLLLTYLIIVRGKKLFFVFFSPFRQLLKTSLFFLLQYTHYYSCLNYFQLFYVYRILSVLIDCFCSFRNRRISWDDETCEMICSYNSMVFKITFYLFFFFLSFSAVAHPN